MAYSIDTRTIKPGDIYIPVKGPNFDGHAFIDEAKKKGASAVLEVDLGTFASEHRKKFNIPIIAVTGSSGKTTVKDMLAAVLSKKFKVLKTEQNQNNEVGVPLTLLKLDDTYEVAVVEMAMRGRGEIEYLAHLAQPTHAVITNIGFAHIGILHTRESIALAKSEVFIKGIQVYLNGNDEYYQFLRKEAEAKECRINSFFADSITAQNASAVRIIAKDLGLSADMIEEGLNAFIPSNNRMEFIACKDNILLINDTYNANPDSMRFALEIMARRATRRTIAVLGDMLELGDYATSEHARLPVEHCSAVVTVGELARTINACPNTVHCMTNAEAIEKTLQLIMPGDTILVKGSRGMHMEEIVAGLREKLSPQR